MTTSGIPTTILNKETAEVQVDWQERELIELVQLNILKITHFLNHFDSSVRYKLSRINERLTTLERTVHFCETAVKGSQGLEAEIEADDEGGQTQEQG